MIITALDSFYRFLSILMHFLMLQLVIKIALSLYRRKKINKSIMNDRSIPKQFLFDHELCVTVNCVIFLWTWLLNPYIQHITKNNINDKTLINSFLHVFQYIGTYPDATVRNQICHESMHKSTMIVRSIKKNCSTCCS